MVDKTVQRRPTPKESLAEDLLTFKSVHLDITDVDRSLAFWCDAVGLKMLSRDGNIAHLGVGENVLVVLHGGMKTPRTRGFTGMYHLALHVPTEADFAMALARFEQAGVQQSPTDHVTHWATYTADPDGLDLEVAFETLDRYAGIEMREPMPLIRTPEGELLPATGPLDTHLVMSALEKRQVSTELAQDTRIGHMHLYVNELTSSSEFYTNKLGFIPNMKLDNVSMYDFSAGGSFPHRLAINAWFGKDAKPRPKTMAGMRYVELEVHDDNERDRLNKLLDKEGFLCDPSGNKLKIV